MSPVHLPKTPPSHHTISATHPTKKKTTRCLPLSYSRLPRQVLTFALHHISACRTKSRLSWGTCVTSSFLSDVYYTRVVTRLNIVCSFPPLLLRSISQLWRPTTAGIRCPRFIVPSTASRSSRPPRCRLLMPALLARLARPLTPTPLPRAPRDSDTLLTSRTTA